MSIAIRKPNRIILFFLFGIVMPSIILGYFALRGIRNDSALAEKKLIASHQRIAQKILSTIDEEIADAERIARDQLLLKKARSSVAVANRFDSLATLPYSAIFSINEKGKISFIQPTLLYLPDESKNYNFQERIGDFVRADYFEFQAKKYGKAIEIYRAALKKHKNTDVRQTILLALGRLYRKSKQITQAIDTYRQLANMPNYAQTVSLHLMAATELAKLTLAQKDTASAMEEFLSMLKDLSQNQLPLTRSEFHFYLQIARDSLNALNKSPFGKINCQMEFDSLNTRIKTRKFRTEKLLTFVHDCRREIIDKTSETKNRRFSVAANGQIYLISFLSLTASGANKSIGILWDGKKLVQKLSDPQFQKQLSLKNSCFRILTAQNNILFCTEDFAAGKLTLQSNFTNNFPPWRLEFYQRDIHLFENFLKLRRSIYLYSFLLIAGILGFGLVLTSIGITREIELAKLKSDFVSTISHELRSPLTSIRQLAEMLQRDRVPTEERKKKYYDVIVEQSEKLSLLINNILDFSKIESKKRRFDFELMDFGEFLSLLLISPVQRLQEDGFKVETEIQKEMPKILIDRASISQIVNNLLDNAAKYSDKEKKIIVRCFQEKNDIVFSVQDFGIGISTEEQGKIFEKFYRSQDEAIRTRIKGSGLGLTLVKLIVEAHRGKIEVISEVGKGSTFKIKLPILN